MSTSATGSTPERSCLLELGECFEALWKAEKALYAALTHDNSPEAVEATNAASNATGVIVHAITAGPPARTMEELRVKARAVSWCYSGEEIDDDKDARTADKLAFSIVRDLLAGRVA